MHFQPKKPRPVTDTGQSSPLNFMPLPFGAGAATFSPNFASPSIFSSKSQQNGSKHFNTQILE